MGCSGATRNPSEVQLARRSGSVYGEHQPVLFVMTPQLQDLDCFFLFQNLIDQTALNVDSTGICLAQDRLPAFHKEADSERVLERAVAEALALWISNLILKLKIL